MSEQQASQEKSIGDIIRQTNNLNAAQMDQIVRYQQEQKVKFGEAAVALGLATRDDVLWALSQQFHYPYSSDSSERLATELIVGRQPFSDEAEAFRDIRSQLMASVLDPEGPTRALAVVSCEVGDGKSFFSANIAIAFSQLGGRTLLVDADMRTPRQHEIFGVPEIGSGLSTVLSGRAETNVIRPIVDLPNLYLLPVGVLPPNPLELVQRPAFGHLIAELGNKFDYVIVDTPASSHGSDARVIAAKCGSALVVSRKNKTRFSSTKKLLESLKRSKVNIAGLTLNDY